jgi:hypothetical protein
MRCRQLACHVLFGKGAEGGWNALDVETRGNSRVARRADCARVLPLGQSGRCIGLAGRESAAWTVESKGGT